LGKNKILVFFLIAMGAVVLVMRLKLAHISLPSEVILINERNYSVVIVRGNVRQVSVEPLRLTHFASTKGSNFLFLP